MKTYRLVDTIQERYLKLKSSAESFGILQYGFCCFYPLNGVWRAEPWNIPILRAPSNDREHGFTFVSQTSSLLFLESHGFDFQSWIQQGISVLANSEYKQKVAQETEFWQRIRSSKAVWKQTAQKLNKVDQEMMQAYVDKVEKGLSEADRFSLSLPSYWHARTLCSLLDMDVYMLFRKGTLYVCTEEGVYDDIINTLEAQALVNLDLARGLGSILDRICQRKVPMVHHNGNHDWLHTIRYLFPLPETWKELETRWKTDLNPYFDTKYIASMDIAIQEMVLKSTALGDLHVLIQNGVLPDPQVELAEGFEDFASEDRYHEAGYDAYVTGLVFLSEKRCTDVHVYVNTINGFRWDTHFSTHTTHRPRRNVYAISSGPDAPWKLLRTLPRFKSSLQLCLSDPDTWLVETQEPWSASDIRSEDLCVRTFDAYWQRYCRLHGWSQGSQGSFCVFQ